MSRRFGSHDPILAAIETRNAPRAKLLRALAALDAHATSCELLEACEIADGDAVLRNTYQAALARLVLSGHATRRPLEASAARARGWRCFVTNGAQFDYELAERQPAPRVPPMPRCSCCGALGHNVRTCVVARSARRARAA